MKTVEGRGDTQEGRQEINKERENRGKGRMMEGEEITRKEKGEEREGEEKDEAMHIEFKPHYLGHQYTFTLQPVV